MPPKKYVMPRAATDPTAAAAQPKQRKPRAPLSKPPGMSNAEWKADLERREAVAADRRNRAKKAREKRRTLLLRRRRNKRKRRARR